MLFVDLIENNLSVCFVGEYGIGKTFCLNKIAKYYDTFVLSPNPCIIELEKLVNKRFKSLKECFNYLLHHERLIIVIDDFHQCRKNYLNYFTKLSKVHTLIISCEKSNNLLEYDFNIINLKRFNYEESKKICNKCGVNGFSCNKICLMSKGLPLFLVNNIKYFNTTGIIKKRIMRKAWKINFAALAYFVLGIRYFARNNHYWELYSILSSVGYSLLALNRFKRK